MTQYFVADPTDKARAGTPSERCVNCLTSYNDHSNGRCPPDSDVEAYNEKLYAILDRLPQ